ncbi:MAG: RNA polymerase sigma factor [Lachnospiraceae bacterium]|nr:RNA polymerase sigma factor [Lachnospiraceae bacterium]
MENVDSVFVQMYQLTYDKVVFYIVTKCGRIPEVEDILQDTYAELFKVLSDKGVEYISAPEGFVMQLARSKVYRYYSEKERQRAYLQVEASNQGSTYAAKELSHKKEWEDMLVDKLTAKEVMDYLATKDELTRDIFYQHYFQDKTLKEIAENCGVKETTVKKRLYRALQELKKMKRFAIIIAILLLTAFFAKPVYSWAEDMIAQIKRYLTEDTKDTLEIVELGRAYKLYMDGKISKKSSINVNGEDYSFDEIEKNWEDNPWLEELDWNNIQ